MIVMSKHFVLFRHTKYSKILTTYMDILYYSNYCQHSKSLLSMLAKSPIKNNYYYVCIDKRRVDNTNTVYIQLETGGEIPLPSIITKVPSLLLPNHGNRVLSGGEIMEYFNASVNQNSPQTQMEEPEPFHLSSNVYDNISSDSYSFLDMSDDDLGAKGGGGTRQMHNYVSMNTNPLISTPQDDYVPDKIGAQGQDSLEKYKAERDRGIPKKPMPVTM